MYSHKSLNTFYRLIFLGFNLLFEEITLLLYNYMYEKKYPKNINILNSIRDRNRNRVPTSTLQKINNIISLYEDRKITQLTTAENLIKGIATNNEKQKAKGLKQYDKAVEKYEDKEPIAERMRATAGKAREAKKS